MLTYTLMPPHTSFWKDVGWINIQKIIPCLLLYTHTLSLSLFLGFFFLFHSFLSCVTDITVIIKL